MEKKILSFLGLANRAGKVASGEFSAEAAVKDRKAKLVIIAADASDNTKKLFHDKSSYYGIPILTFGTKETLGGAIGKQMRASLAILDEGFAEKLKEMIQKQEVK
ncbi:MAG: ribosomal L7Ae/L30e/S12e/Gadd45 family protein [Lachnospiraceae bacterium]|nr:ribosomal L7Ae/L30e/S12e/Gadd45 family protein [Lachnospiraceae bacterium]